MSVSFSDLVKEPERKNKYLIEPVFIEGSYWLVGAPANTGKSLFAMNIAHALASGETFLNRFQIVERRRVLIIDKEIGREAVKSRLRLFYPKLSEIPEDALYVVKEEEDAQFYIDSEAYQEHLLDIIEREKVDVLIFDPLNPLLSQQETGETYQNMFLNLDQVLWKHPTLSIVLVHHMSQAPYDSKADPLSLERIRGHGKIVDYPGTRTTMLRLPPKDEVREEFRLRIRWFTRFSRPPEDQELIVSPNFRIYATDKPESFKKADWKNA